MAPAQHEGHQERVSVPQQESRMLWPNCLQAPGSPSPSRPPGPPHLCSPEQLRAASTGAGPSTGLPAKSSPGSDPAGLLPPSATCWKHHGETPRSGRGTSAGPQAVSLSCGQSPCVLVTTVRNKGRPPKRATKTRQSDVPPPSGLQRPVSRQDSPEKAQRSHPSTACI